MDAPNLMRVLTANDEDGVVDHFKPILTVIARRIAANERDDLVQEGLMKILRLIRDGRVDLDRPSTANAFLIQSANNHMRSTIRRRRVWLSTFTDLKYIDDRCREDPQIDDTEFHGILALYLEYATHNCDMHGANAWVASRLGISTSAACTLFRKAAHEFKKNHPEIVIARRREFAGLAIFD